MNEKLNFYYHILVRNVQVSATFRKMCLIYYYIYKYIYIYICVCVYRKIDR